VVTLTNVGSTYDAIVASQGLGIGYFDFTGRTQAMLMVKHQKIGTGTQTYQLWNETDGVEIGVVNDANAAGAPRNLTGTFSINGSGIKLLRIRAKSTVAADDPIFLRGTIYLL
jgi:hypothetical protein